MSYGNLMPYLRPRFGREAPFSTGSLVFDAHRQMQVRENREEQANSRPPARR